MVDFEKAMKEAREAAQKEAIDEIFKHEIGCACAFCETCRSRFPTAPTNSPEDFARAGGEHQTYPFDTESTMHLASIARSLQVIAESATLVRNVLRGRDANGEIFKSPWNTLADRFLGIGKQSTGPATQRAPAPAQAKPTMPAPAPQQKRVADDAEMQRLINSLGKFDFKIRFDSPRNWPGASQKGKRVLANVGGVLVSEVDPDYLGIYADSLEYFATKAKERVASGSTEKRDLDDAKYNESTAAQCRRVAQMVKAGQVQRHTPVAAYSGNDYE